MLPKLSQMIKHFFLLPVGHIHQVTTGAGARLLGPIKCFGLCSNVITKRPKSSGALQKTEAVAAEMHAGVLRPCFTGSCVVNLPACSPGWSPFGRLHWAWWRPSSCRRSRKPSRSCGRTTWHPAQDLQCSHLTLLARHTCAAPQLWTFTFPLM